VLREQDRRGKGRLLVLRLKMKRKMMATMMGILIRKMTVGTMIMRMKGMKINILVKINKKIVTPQNRHLADYSDHAAIYMMSLWKCTTKRLMHVAACT
jgi:hypothetical protein